ILTSSYKSCLGNWYTYITRSVTLSPPSLALSLKILPIFRLFTKGIVSSYLIYCYPSLILPSIASICYTILIALILSINKVMLSCSCCIKKGLVCIAVIAPSGHQPLSYIKCIKVNICLFHNNCSVSAAKCIYYLTFFNYLIPYLSCHR